jgi:hypothetical protein
MSIHSKSRELRYKESRKSYPEPPQEGLNIFVFCHGGTTTQDDIRYSRITYINNVSYVSPPHHILNVTTTAINTASIYGFVQNRDVNVVSEIIYSEEIPGSPYRTINLPPMIYTPDQVQNSNLSRMMGIYEMNENYTAVKKTIKTNQQLINENRAITSQEPLISGQRILTFSKIEQIISEYVRLEYPNRRNLYEHRVNLRIYCCRSSMYDGTHSFSSTYIQPPQPPTYNPVIADEPTRYQKLSEDLIMNRNFELFGFRGDVNIVQNWNPLLWGVDYQGCGLNVLAYYGLLPQEDASSRASVLYKTGTSIYKFIDYISSYYRLQTPNASYISIKFSNRGTVSTICWFYLSTTPIRYIPMKIYRQADPDREDGHFVSVIKINECMSIWDPQTNTTLSFTEYLTQRQSVSYSLVFYHPNSITDNEQTNPIPYIVNPVLESLIDRHADEITIQRRQDLNLLWGGLKSSQTKNIENKITPMEMDKINKIKYDLIKNYQLTIFCDDEFQMLIPKDELKNMMKIEIPYEYTPPIKTISLEKLFLESKNKIRSKLKTNQPRKRLTSIKSKAKTRKAKTRNTKTMKSKNKMSKRMTRLKSSRMIKPEAINSVDSL